MKIFGLCFLFFVGLAPISQGQDSPKPKSDQAAIESAPAPADRIILNLDSDLSPSPYSYCAYMRTYRVKRDHPGSDMTRLAGYTTCVPSKRFEMRSAVQVQSEPVSAEKQH
jgi:hypothetical protein